MEETERYKEIYEELGIKTNPLFDHSNDNEKDLGELIENLASFFSREGNYPQYPAFIKKYDKIRSSDVNDNDFSELNKGRLFAIEKALRYATKKRK